MATSMRFSWAASALAVLTLTVPAGAVPQAPAPAELARSIQTHYASVANFSADFTHSFKGGLLPQTTTEKGSVKIKKPGRMRWTYDKPNEKEFVSDGRMLYSYVKADRTCYVTDVPQGDNVSTAVLFLAGKGDLVRDFRASPSPKSSATEWQVVLKPIKPQAEFTELTLGVDPKTLKLVSMTTIDSDGGVSAFRFDNLKENVSLNDKDFVFTPPKGVDVIR